MKDNNDQAKQSQEKEDAKGSPKAKEEDKTKGQEKEEDNKKANNEKDSPKNEDNKKGIKKEQQSPEETDRSRPEDPTQRETKKDYRDDEKYLNSLRTFAERTVLKSIPELEAEFIRLRSLPRPVPSPEFTRNPELNRYKDVVCVENNRVKLKNGRYIHANWVDYAGERRFICTQGPLLNTVDDFWTMIAQENVEAIVMLCDVVENGREKCAQYWPTKVSPVYQSKDGNIKVTFNKATYIESSLFKTFLDMTILDNAPKQLKVRHFHWRQWPDRAAPLNHLAALRLVHYLSTYDKVVVHCSAGIGRTGTIVAIHLAEQWMKTGQNLDLYELTRELRQQRALSVQTVEQYLYIYSVLLRFSLNKAIVLKWAIDIPAIEKLVQGIARRLQQY